MSAFYYPAGKDDACSRSGLLGFVDIAIGSMVLRYQREREPKYWFGW
jgi:hypothetical protein